MHALAALAAAALAAAPPAETGGLDAVPAGDGIRIHVAKRGLFAMFAHDHDFEVTRWRGTAELPGGDPARASIDVVLDAGSLRDREAKLSEGDRSKVDAQAAGPEVLDAAHAPEIRYRSERVSVDAAAADGGSVRGTIHGLLTIRGRTRPVDARFVATRAGEAWSVEGSARFEQSAFGLEPFRGLGGTVGVKDEVLVTFQLALRPSPGGGSAPVTGPTPAPASPPTR